MWISWRTVFENNHSLYLFPLSLVSSQTERLPQKRFLPRNVVATQLPALSLFLNSSLWLPSRLPTRQTGGSPPTIHKNHSPVQKHHTKPTIHYNTLLRLLSSRSVHEKSTVRTVAFCSWGWIMLSLNTTTTAKIRNASQTHQAMRTPELTQQ